MKRKQNIALILAILLFTMTLLTTVTASSNLEHNSEHLAVDSSNTTLAQDENPAFSQADLNDNFKSYVTGKSRVTLPTTYSIEGTANVVGIVLDKETQQPVINATVAADGEMLVVTNDAGRFQICNMPNGTYDWNVNADGYRSSCYLNYSVHWASGTDIFTFELSKEHEITKDRLEFECYHEHAETQESILEEAQGNIAEDHLISTMSLSSVPSVAAKVRVEGYSNPIPREQYIYTVVMSELYSPEWYMSKNKGTGRENTLTSIQVDQLYMVQVLAANTYLEYSLSVEGNHPGKPFDICDGRGRGCCQAYDPTKNNQRAIDTTARFFSGNKCKVLFYMNSNGTLNYALCNFFSSCYGAGTETNPWHPEMVATKCSDFDRGHGHGQNRYGMCQMGAAELARLNYGNSDIRSYYYKNTIPCDCTMI